MTAAFQQIYPASSSIFQVDLVGTNAEASNDEQVLGMFQDFSGELGLASARGEVEVRWR